MSPCVCGCVFVCLLLWQAEIERETPALPCYIAEVKPVHNITPRCPFLTCSKTNLARCGHNNLHGQIRQCVHPRTQLPRDASDGRRGIFSRTRLLYPHWRMWETSRLTCKVFRCVFSFLLEIIIIKTGNEAKHRLKGMSRCGALLLVAVFVYDTFEVSSRCCARRGGCGHLCGSQQGYVACLTSWLDHTAQGPLLI